MTWCLKPPKASICAFDQQMISGSSLAHMDLNKPHWLKEIEKIIILMAIHRNRMHDCKTIKATSLSKKKKKGWLISMSIAIPSTFNNVSTSNNVLTEEKWRSSSYPKIHHSMQQLLFFVLRVIRHKSFLAQWRINENFISWIEKITISCSSSFMNEELLKTSHCLYFLHFSLRISSKSYNFVPKDRSFPSTTIYMPSRSTSFKP